jgi:repressor of nif and glnA expression
LARKWMESETDIEILKLLGRFGPLTGKAVVAMVNFREESRVRYRLWYLGKMGYIRNRAYCEPAGKKNKVMKRGAVYYLSTAAVRYLRNKGMDVPASEVAFFTEKPG